MIKKILTNIGKRSKSALVHRVDTKKKNKVLIDYCSFIRKNQKLILSANKKDVNRSISRGVKKNLIERLILNEKKIDNIISSIKSVIKLKDPTNRVLEKWNRPNGLSISKISIPIGIIAIIYESRPNVTSDVASLCFKSGNPVILRGGSEAFFSNKILSKLFRDSLKKNNINENFVQFIDSTNRNIVDYLLNKMDKYVDVVIPRGGKNLVKKVQKLSNLPVIGHLEGVCHTYIDKNANLNTAKKIIFNAINDAINHINRYGTMHTDSIITMNKKSAKKFLNEVKSSIAMHNTSTQFADGGEFGFGGEVGISTNKLPPRGPVGLNQLVSYKYQISSNGRIRK